MASVWEAEDELLGRRVAVKVLAEHLAEDVSARERFQREARAAAAVSDHPNVVTIFDVNDSASDHGGRPYIVMELMTGGSVAQRLREGRPPRPRRCTGWPTRPRRSTTPTPGGWCTATSSPATCCWTGAVAWP